ncbi:hypothetical protein IE4803_PD00098 (plasmid) [Rhizobium etli bv. phaseoli str. IE4803]|nr:hypothetical protein IE4803_PD00098 [Rhizobium etli bv. phaseoli str. IE4803]
MTSTTWGRRLNGATAVKLGYRCGCCWRNQDDSGDRVENLFFACGISLKGLQLVTISLELLLFEFRQAQSLLADRVDSRAKLYSCGDTLVRTDICIASTR